MWLALRAIVGVFADVVRLGMLFLRSASSIRAENLVLRKQLAWYIERAVEPRRIDHKTRGRLVLFSRLCRQRAQMLLKELQ
jgi:hypothetical protein